MLQKNDKGHLQVQNNHVLSATTKGGEAGMLQRLLH